MLSAIYRVGDRFRIRSSGIIKVKVKTSLPIFLKLISESPIWIFPSSILRNEDEMRKKEGRSNDSHEHNFWVFCLLLLSGVAALFSGMRTGRERKREGMVSWTGDGEWRGNVDWFSGMRRRAKSARGIADEEEGNKGGEEKETDRSFSLYIRIRIPL